MRFKAFDKDAMFWDAQSMAAFTIGAHYSSSVDLKAADIDEFNPGEVQCSFTGLVGTGATILLALQDSADNSSFAAVTPMGITSVATAITDASLADIRFTIPRVGVRRYVRLACTVATADITAGTANAGLVK